MTALLRRDNLRYQNQTIYATANAYFGCEFLGCVMVFKGFPCAFVNCRFTDCVWDLDFILHDPEQLAALAGFLEQVVKNSLPAVRTEPTVAARPSESALATS